MSIDRRALAYHQAGHVIVAGAAGYVVNAVDLFDDISLIYGLTDTRDPSVLGNREGWSYGSDAAILWGCYLAERIADHTAELIRFSHSDRQALDWVAERAIPARAERQRWLHEQGRRAAELLDRDWADVRVVADQLQMSGWLTGAEVTAIVNVGRARRGQVVMR